MAGKSDYLEDKILNHVLRNTAYTSPTTVYLGVLTVTPSDTAAGTEVSGNAYARQAITCSAPSGNSPSTCTNSADILFPVATPSNWGAIVAFGIYDALTAGNLLYWGALSVTINANDQLKIAAGSLTVNED